MAIGFRKQADLVTALLAANLWTLQLTNTEPLKAEPVNEDNKADLGKGVYATNVYPSHFISGGPWNGRLTSEAGAMLACFGIGKTTKSAHGINGGLKYTCVAPQLQSDGLDMPSTTAVVQIGAVSDKSIIGLCCEEFGIQFASGPGRDNATFTSTWVGTGKHAKPSAITIPAAYSEHSLNAGGLTALTLIGFNYLTNKRFVSANLGFKSNIREQSAYHPGSGSQSGYQLRGRMRRGVPDITLQAVVECDSGSSEEDALLAQTEGTGVITCEGGLIGAGPETHMFKITFHRLRVKAAPLGDSDGIASYSLDYSVLEHASNGVFTIEATCEQDNILSAPA